MDEKIHFQGSYGGKAGHASSFFALAMTAIGLVVYSGIQHVNYQRLCKHAEVAAMRSVGDQAPPLTAKEKEQWLNQMGVSEREKPGKKRLQKFINDTAQVYSRDTWTPDGKGTQYVVVKGASIESYIFCDNKFLGKNLMFEDARIDDWVRTDARGISVHKKRVMGLDYELFGG